MRGTGRAAAGESARGRGGRRRKGILGPWARGATPNAPIRQQFRYLLLSVEDYVNKRGCHPCSWSLPGTGTHQVNVQGKISIIDTEPLKDS